MEQPTREEELGPLYEIFFSASRDSKWRYEAILHHCINKNVFDFGCGSGHGSRMLSVVAKSVQAWEKHSEVYRPREGVTFTDNPTNVGIVTAVEVIEHIEKEDLRILLKKWSESYSETVVTTPNGDLFPYHPKDKSERRGYHVWHYTRKELYDLFEEFYGNVKVHDVIWDGVREKFTAYKVYGASYCGNIPGRTDEAYR